jgi:hypothetical protein
MGIFECIFNQNTEENIVCPDNTDETIDRQPLATTQPVTDFINNIKKGLLNADSVVISGFGKFYVTPLHIENADLYIVIKLRLITEYNKGGFISGKVTVAKAHSKTTDPSGRRLECAMV